MLAVLVIARFRALTLTAFMASEITGFPAKMEGGITYMLPIVTSRKLASNGFIVFLAVLAGGSAQMRCSTIVSLVLIRLVEHAS